MRARNIKPGFFRNESLPDCSMQARLMFIGLWCFADRSGYFEYRPKMIKAELFPYEDCDVESYLCELGKCGFIEIYEHPETSDPVFGHIINFSKHQNPHKNEKLSEIEPIICSGMVKARYKHDACTIQALYKNGDGTK